MDSTLTTPTPVPGAPYPGVPRLRCSNEPPSDPRNQPTGSGVPLTAPAMVMPELYGRVTLDIETANGRPEDVERWARMQWAPNPRLKPATIGQKYLDALEAKTQKLALMDEAPVIIVGVKSETEARLLHCMEAHEPKQEHGALVEGFDSERNMLIALRNVLDSFCTPETLLVGHNIEHFDLPKLRFRYVHAKVRQPRVLLDGHQPVFDSMLEYGRRFTQNKNPFIAAADLAELLGLQNGHKSLISGKDVPELYASGQYDVLLQYNRLDLHIEERFFLTMTGQAADLA